MARKWDLFFRRLQSFLGKRYLAFSCGIVMLLFCVTIQPLLFSGERVNAMSSAPIAVDSADDPLTQSQQLYQAGDYPAAIQLLERSIDTYRSRGDTLKQAMSLSNLALVHQELGQWDAANRSLAASLRLLQNPATSERSSILAQTLDIQGQLQLAQGQTEAALATWEQTEKLYVRMGDDGGIVRSRINRAQALRVLGFYRRSQTILEELQTTLATKPDSAIKVVALRSLGTALEQSGDLDKAVAVLDRGLKIAQKLNLDREVSATQLVLGNVSRTQKKLPIASNYYAKAADNSNKLVSIQAKLNLLSLQIENRQIDAADRLITPIEQQLSTLPSNRIKLNAQINFAQSLARLNRRETAAKVLADVIQQSQKLPDRRTQSLALGSLGELYKQQRQWADAEDATSRALTVITNANADDLAYRWYAQLGYVLAQQQGKDKQAIESYTMAIDTLKLLRKDLVNINRDVQFTFKESVEPTYRELVSLLLKPENQQPNGQNLERSRNLIEALQVAELDNFFREACLNNENVIIDEVVDSPGERLRQRKNPTAAIIYPIILENELQVIVKIPGQKILKQHRVAKNKQQVELVLHQLQDLLLETDRVRDIKKLSQEMYSWLVAPFEAEFNGKIDTLVFVLDGSFRNVPMSILYDGKQYLIEKKYAIATNLGLRLQSPKPISKTPLHILAAGLAKPSAQFAKSFSELPEVPAQLKAIRSTGIDLTELKDSNFTIKAFGKEVKDTPYNVIHLATHGQFSSKIEETFLLANDDKLNVLEFDRLLRERAQIQRTPIELLVMSACETAVGDNRATLGLAGVAVKAGAQSTLASLWKVKDSSTAVLMGEFYRELKTGKVSKAEALRLAQVKLMKEYSNFSAPLYWAPFILVGNWL
jgi:CHAT domain-containing protein